MNRTVIGGPAGGGTERLPDAAAKASEGRGMKPWVSILDPLFEYVPSMATSVAGTWRRFGWRPTTSYERQRRLVERGDLIDAASYIAWPDGTPATDALQTPSGDPQALADAVMRQVRQAG